LFIGEKTEERRLFTFDERKYMLSKSHGRCSCCGKKITTKNMTCEHVVPISRGGTNNLENLVALCQECNDAKGNLLYMPETFYTYLDNKYFKEICSEFYKWFSTNKDNFNLTRYPLITPVTRLPVFREINNKKFLIGKFDLHYVNRQIRAEVEAVTSLTLDDSKAYYLFKSVKDDKLLMLYSVYWYGLNLNITIEWSILGHMLVTATTATLMRIVLDLYHNIGINLSTLSVDKDDKKFFDKIILYRDTYSNHTIGCSKLSSDKYADYSGIMLNVKRDQKL
jgi:hypothetical protein